MARGKVRLAMSVWGIVSDVVERGVVCGYARAHKYADRPDEATFIGAIQDAVMNELSEAVDFESSGVAAGVRRKR